MKRLWLGLAVALSCVPPTPAPPPAGPAVPAAADEIEAETLYAEASARFEVGEYADADSLAQLVVDTYPDTHWAADALWLVARAALERGAHTRAKEATARYAALFPAGHPRWLAAEILLARILIEGLQPWEAAETLLITEPYLTGALRDSAAELLRGALRMLPLREIDALIARHPERSAFRAALYAERALLLAAEGRVAEARAAAEGALASDPLTADAAHARGILRARNVRRRGPPAIAAILPLSGHLAPYGRSLREGIELAVDEHVRATGDSIELVLVDDSSSGHLSGARLAEVETRGVLGIVGLITPEALRAGAARRSQPDLVLVSPLATDAREIGPNVYSLWFSTADLQRLARAVAQFGVDAMGARRIAAVFPTDSTGYRQYEAFAAEAQRLGAEIVAAQPYDAQATTFEAPLARVDSLDPEAVYAVAASPRGVIQLAPQLSYYGLRGVQVFGDPSWAEPEAVRMVEPRFTNGAVVATYFPPWSPQGGRERFADMYESRYRKRLGNNLIPPLGYDATSLLLRALPTGVPQPAVLARALRSGQPYEGATGVLRVEGDEIRREVFVVEVRDRRVLRAIPRPILRPPAPSEEPPPPSDWP